MDVRIYRSEKLQTAMNQIRKDLGQQAVILNSRTKIIEKNGLKQCLYEVMAVPQEERKKAQASTEKVSFPHLTDPTRLPLQTENYSWSGQDNLSILENVSSGFDAFLKELSAFKSDLERYHRNLQKPYLPNDFLWLKNLVLNSISQNFEHPFLKELQAKGCFAETFRKFYETYQSEKDLSESMANFIIEEFQINETFENYTQETSPLILLHGPSGSGKSTFLAKWAAYLQERFPKKKILYLLLNRVKVGGHEPLESFAKLLSCDSPILSDLKEAPNQIKSLQGDFVFLEAPSFETDPHFFEQIQNFSYPNQHHILLLNSFWQEAYAMKCLETYQALLPLKALAFSRLDESYQPGFLLSASSFSQKPVCYLNFGRQLDAPFEMCQRERFLENLMESKL